jgi:hypothetical protein
MMKGSTSAPCRLVMILAVVCVILSAVWPVNVEAQPTTGPLVTAIDHLKNLPSRLENLEAALEAFFPVSPTDLPSGPAFGEPEAGDDPLPSAPPVMSPRSVPPEATDAVFDLRQSLRRQFVKVTGDGGTPMTRAQFLNLAPTLGLPPFADPDGYFERHDRNQDGMLSISEFTPSVEEIARTCDVYAITEAFLDGSAGYSPSLRPENSQKGRRVRRGWVDGAPPGQQRQGP